MACLNELMSEVVYDFSFPVWSLVAIIISSMFVFFGIKRC
jgi:uncharacterized membrane protein